MTEPSEVPADLEWWERLLRHWLERNPRFAAKVGATLESEAAVDKATLLYLTVTRTLLFVGTAAFVAAVFTVLALTVGHPWEYPATAMWVTSAIMVAVVYGEYRKDKASLKRAAAAGLEG